MLKNVERALAKLAQMHSALSDAAQAALETTAQNALADAQSAAPVDTGRLRGSLCAECAGTSARVSTACPYAAAVEHGSSRQAARPNLAPAPARHRPNFASLSAQLARERLG